MVRLKFGPTLLEPGSPHRQPPVDIAGCDGVRIGHVAAPSLRRLMSKTCGLVGKQHGVTVLEGRRHDARLAPRAKNAECVRWLERLLLQYEMPRLRLTASNAAECGCGS